jgi:hypothetical protein
MSREQHLTIDKRAKKRAARLDSRRPFMLCCFPDRARDTSRIAAVIGASRS